MGHLSHIFFIEILGLSNKDEGLEELAFFLINFVYANLMLQDVNKEMPNVVFGCCTCADLENKYRAVLPVEISAVFNMWLGQVVATDY